MSWEPSTEFEEEILSAQPDHDYIFTDKPVQYYPRPQSHLDYVFSRENRKQKTKPKDLNTQKLHVISTVQELTNSKPLGELPSNEDWNDQQKSIEQEAIALMRNLGIGPCVDESLNPKCTIASYPVTKKIHVTKNGSKRLPIIYDDNFFKLKPKWSSSMNGSDHSGQEQKQQQDNAQSLIFERKNSKDAEISFGSTLDNTFDTKSSEEVISYLPLKSSNQKKGSQNKKFFTPKELYDKKRGCKNKNSI